jgi:hypothetical protein
MNTTEAEASRQQQAETVSRLLKEYSDKLNLMATRLLGIPARGYGNKWTHEALLSESATIIEAWGVIAPTLESLTRYASQMLEHFALEKLSEIELTLRLRETEQALDAVQFAADTLKRRYPDFFPAPQK